MGRHKDERIRKIQQIGKKGSYYITLPIGIVRKLNWREHQKLKVQFDPQKKRIIIEPWRK